MRMVVLTEVAIVLLLLASFAVAAEKVEVTGEYQYTYGDRESLEEAKQIAYTMAVRRAIESYQVFIESTATVQNYQMIKDLVQVIASGYLQNLTAHETVSGRTVICKVRASLVPEQVRAIIQEQVEHTKSNSSGGIDENKVVRILSVHERKQISRERMEELRSVFTTKLDHYGFQERSSCPSASGQMHLTFQCIEERAAAIRLRPLYEALLKSLAEDQDRGWVGLPRILKTREQFLRNTKQVNHVAEDEIHRLGSLLDQEGSSRPEIGQVTITYKQIGKGQTSIMVELLDAEGQQVDGKKLTTESLQLGEVRRVTFEVPDGVYAYTVGLPKE